MATVGQVPVRTDVVEQATKEQPYFAIFFEQLKTAKARLPHPNWPKIEDLLTSTGQAILRAEKSAKEALDELAPKVDSLLAVE
jgi:multiple sugar transport system substrate-binding protein